MILPWISPFWGTSNFLLRDRENGRSCPPRKGGVVCHQIPCDLPNSHLADIGRDSSGPARPGSPVDGDKCSLQYGLASLLVHRVAGQRSVKGLQASSCSGGGGDVGCQEATVLVGNPLCE